MSLITLASRIQQVGSVAGAATEEVDALAAAALKASPALDRMKTSLEGAVVAAEKLEKVAAAVAGLSTGRELPSPWSKSTGADDGLTKMLGQLKADIHAGAPGGDFSLYGAKYTDIIQAAIDQYKAGKMTAQEATEYIQKAFATQYTAIQNILFSGTKEQRDFLDELTRFINSGRLL